MLNLSTDTNQWDYSVCNIEFIYGYNSVGNNPQVMLNLPTDTNLCVNSVFLVVCLGP